MLARPVIYNLENKPHQLHANAKGNEDKYSIQEELQQAYYTEAVQLKQKARLQWDLEGDNNSRFFHKMV